MTNVVDHEAVTVAPFAHVVALERRAIVMPEGLVGEVVSQAGIEGGPPDVEDQVLVERLNEGALEIELL